MTTQLENKKQTLWNLLSKIPLSSAYDSARIAQEVSRLTKEIENEEMKIQSSKFLHTNNKLGVG